MEIAETIKFKDICSMLERVKKSNLQSKEKYLRRYYESFLNHRQVFRREQSIEETAEEAGNSSFYCVLRCLIPGADSARPPYGMQITSLGKIYIKVLTLPQDSRDVQRLHARSHSGIHGDYADIVYSVLLPRVQCEPSELTLKEIHEMLDTIAEDDRKNTERVLTSLAEKASAKEQMWFIRLLLKTMHLGIGEQRVLACLHPQAKELYQRCSNLLRVCCLLADNKLTVLSSSSSSSLNIDAAIVPFQHIRPMLCEIFPGDIAPLMADDLLYVETKMDGERFQLHFANGTFKYISRNGKDYTKNFGENYNVGNLTPHLQELLPIGLKSIIIDGEMMVWDERVKKFRDKGENTDVKHLSSGGENTWRPCFVAYDLLYLDGQSMLDMSYAQRTYKLKCLLTERTGILHVIKPIKVTSVEEFQQLFQKALDDNQEGVVVKKQRSVYRPGIRNNGGWYKIKADYIEGLTQEFDLLIMGGFYNRTRTWIESFLLGVLSREETGRFDVYSVGRVANITRQRSVFNDILKPHWRNLVTQPPPLWYHYENRNPEGKPDVWIDPHNSIILQVRAADLTNSTAFALKKCLHFPRIVKYRPDKDWLESLTLEEFQNLYQGSGRSLKKINKRQLTTDDFTTHRKRHKLTAVDKRKLGMLSYERKFNPDEIGRSSDLLNGISVCVLSGALGEGISPDELKAMIVCNGGEIVENPIYSDPSCICIAGDITYRVERLLKVCKCNIVNISWLIQGCASGELRNLRPMDLICTTESLREKFKENYDEYGDSFEIDDSMEDLKIILDGITDNQVKSFESSASDIEKLAESLQVNQFFKDCAADCCFYGSSQRLIMAQLLYEWYGGKLVSNTKDNRHKMRYVFIDVSNFEKEKFKTWLSEEFGTQLKNLQAVNIDWIMHSHKDKRIMDICEYTWLDL